MTAFKKADILMPQGVDLGKWSVVACDQYTSQPEYWKEVEAIVGASPSTLNITFPEVYLSEGDSRIEKINKTMEEYLSSGIFKEYPQSLIYIEREIEGKIRPGIIGCVDLEEYDYKKGSETQIRATEGTVLERIPPRVKIRENAPLELPHIMLLIDDMDCDIIEPLANLKENMENLYNFQLMQGGGSLRGYLIPQNYADNIISKLEVLSSSESFNKRYNITGKDPLTYAVGDGNHSLATAKACWENLKKTLTPQEIETHPARFALCELENIHSKALEFEPIHRVVFDVDPENLLKELKKYYSIEDTHHEGQRIDYITSQTSGTLWIKNSKSPLAVGTLQSFLDEYLKENSGTVDYIHGDDVCKDLGKKPGNIGFILPPMEKSDLFAGVIADGALPRKTFSMGEAHEKKFYLEAKMIK